MPVTELIDLTYKVQAVVDQFEIDFICGRMSEDEIMSCRQAVKDMFEQLDNRMYEGFKP